MCVYNISAYFKNSGTRHMLVFRGDLSRASIWTYCACEQLSSCTSSCSFRLYSAQLKPQLRQRLWAPSQWTLQYKVREVGVVVLRKVWLFLWVPNSEGISSQSAMAVRFSFLFARLPKHPGVLRLYSTGYGDSGKQLTISCSPVAPRVFTDLGCTCISLRPQSTCI